MTPSELAVGAVFGIAFFLAAIIVLGALALVAIAAYVFGGLVFLIPLAVAMAACLWLGVRYERSLS